MADCMSTVTWVAYFSQESTRWRDAEQCVSFGIHFPILHLHIFLLFQTDWHTNCIIHNISCLINFNFTSSTTWLQVLRICNYFQEGSREIAFPFLLTDVSRGYAD